MNLKKANAPTKATIAQFNRTFRRYCQAATLVPLNPAILFVPREWVMTHSGKLINCGQLNQSSSTDHCIEQTRKNAATANKAKVMSISGTAKRA